MTIFSYKKDTGIKFLKLKEVAMIRTFEQHVEFVFENGTSELVSWGINHSALINLFSNLQMTDFPN
ncbi:hypothetical protein SAMN04515674_105253 [Pseudarcicella hirudinis]|uniref:Uncharacterized protein n=2 Tax=Pseudarcicella hirudinis TaxID=1079859 RepID=A0A1I5SWV2_9BACT|nr:hypothetical protein SAMN04515674_105253 [Pseudarcicella hirudinis]